MYNDNSGDYKIENFIAKVGGVLLSDLSEMEEEFMGQLDFKSNLNLDEYEDLSYKIRKYGD